MKQFIAFCFGIACGVWITLDVVLKIEQKRLIELQRETIQLQDEFIEKLQKTRQ
jgi:hypothetical protein